MAAVLIYAGVGALRVGQVETVARTSMTSRVALVTTFVATLFLPVAAAVGIGVALSLMLQLNQEALDLSVKRLVPTDDGHLVETEAPKVLRARATSSRSTSTARSSTPVPARCRPGSRTRPVPTARSSCCGSGAVRPWARRPSWCWPTTPRASTPSGGSLYLTGLDETLVSQWERLGLGEEYENIHIYPAGAVLGGSTYAALLDARARQVRADPVDRPTC